MEPILTRTFEISRTVRCGFCEGTGCRDLGFGVEKCGFCGGSGELIDVRKGSVCLYPKTVENGTK